MTKLLFVLDENTLAALEIPRPADELAEALRHGDALPEAGAFNPEGQTGWRVLQLGGLVIVALEPGAAPPPDLPPALDPPLSARQRQVLDLLRQGLTTRQIALHLKISIRTVHFHVAALKAALGAQTRCPDHLAGRGAGGGIEYNGLRGYGMIVSVNTRNRIISFLEAENDWLESEGR